MSNRENEDVLWYQTSFWEGKIRLRRGRREGRGRKHEQKTTTLKHMPPSTYPITLLSPTVRVSTHTLPHPPPLHPCTSLLSITLTPTLTISHCSPSQLILHSHPHRLSVHPHSSPFILTLPLLTLTISHCSPSQLSLHSHPPPSHPHHLSLFTLTALPPFSPSPFTPSPSLLHPHTPSPSLLHPHNPSATQAPTHMVSD